MAWTAGRGRPYKESRTADSTVGVVSEIWRPDSEPRPLLTVTVTYSISATAATATAVPGKRSLQNRAVARSRGSQPYLVWTVTLFTKLKIYGL